MPPSIKSGGALAPPAPLYLCHCICIFYVVPNHETIIAEKDKHIAELKCQLESLQKKPSIDSSQLVHQNVQFTLGKLILTCIV